MASAPKFKVIEGWEKLPAGYVHKDVDGVAVDSKDNVYLMTRQDAQLIVYDRNGNFLRSWGKGLFTQRTHGVAIGPDDMVYAVDDGDHTVRKFTPEGKQVMMIGTPGKPSDTGYDGKTHASVQRGGPPFNRPTDAAIAPDGEIYVCDGYGNARVHRFTPDGTLIQSWGEPGSGPGQFRLPHGIGVSPDDRVFVTDRENDRIHIYARDGKPLEHVDARPAPHGHLLRQGRPGVRLGALVAPGPVVVHQRQDQVRPAGRRAGPGPGGERAPALVQRRPGGPGKLRLPAHDLRRFARGSLRGRGDLDLRRVEIRRARGHPHLPEIRAR